MKTLRYVYSIMLLCCGLPVAQAQEIYTPPPSEHVTTVPFVLAAESVVLVRGVMPDYSDTLTFVLDTGSSGISLDSTVAQQLGLVPVPSDISIRGVAGIRQAFFLYNRQLKLGGALIDSLDFHINDYQFLSYVYGERIDGVIGYALFSRYIVKVNYDSLTMELHTLGSMKYPRGGHLLRPFIRTLPVHMAQINDSRRVNSRFLLDVGAGLPLILTQDFDEDSAVIRSRRKRFPLDAYGVGGKLTMDLTLVRTFRLGPYRFRRVPVLVFDDVYNVTSYPYLGGLIGNQILKRFNAIFNYAKREIHIKPNSLFREPFSYWYSGLELYAIDGKIIIGSVVKGSPADLAGAREGDVVLSVGNDLSQDFNQYRRMLMYSGRRVPMIVRRGDALETFTIRVQRIK